MRTKVPKDIRDAIRKAGNFREKAKKYEDIIERWFEKMGVEDDDSFRDIFIDAVQQSNNPEDAIACFESIIKN